MITLLSVVRDSDVRARDTEVGEGMPLTSPFIEGIYGMAIGASIVNHRFLGSAFGLARNDMLVALFGEHFLYLRLSA